MTRGGGWGPRRTLTNDEECPLLLFLSLSPHVCSLSRSSLSLLSTSQTNKASAQGDYQGANAASRQALWLSVLSIVFGIITYICAIAALISYLSGKPP